MYSALSDVCAPKVYIQEILHQTLLHTRVLPEGRDLVPERPYPD